MSASKKNEQVAKKGSPTKPLDPNANTKGSPSQKLGKSSEIEKVKKFKAFSKQDIMDSQTRQIKKIEEMYKSYKRPSGYTTRIMLSPSTETMAANLPPSLPTIHSNIVHPPVNLSVHASSLDQASMLPRYIYLCNNDAAYFCNCGFTSMQAWQLKAHYHLNPPHMPCPEECLYYAFYGKVYPLYGPNE